MPSIVATPYPTRGHVLVEADLSDVSGATNVCVEAVTGSGTSSEVRRQLHPYVSYNSDGCESLSCGHAIFWDTEISCGVATQYCATAINAAGAVMTKPAPNLVTDTFTRVVANSWGTADSGQAWTSSGGAAADFSVTGTRGQMALTSTAVQRVSMIDGPQTNIDEMVTVEPTVVALTSAFQAKMTLRRNPSANNDYRVTLQFNTGGTLTLTMERNLAGVFTSLGSVTPGFTYIATTLVNLRLRAWGNQIMAKTWDATTPEPAAWDISATDTAITSGGSMELRAQRLAGNTNGTINIRFDNFIVADVCADPVPIIQCTGNTIIECDGCFRLGDPVRPCNDVRICLCADGVTCGQTPGLFFAGMTPDTYASNSGNILPVNGKYPIVISRTRRGAAGQFDIVATSFTMRDALLNLLDPGSVLLWRGPATFGTGDRYISVGDVPVAPQISDLTIQERVMSLPFLTTKGPVGPTQGVCGARVKDLCDIYATWDAMVTAGLTYADLLRGDASNPGSGLATWADINAQNADWNTLLVNEPDWNDVVDGD